MSNERVGFTIGADAGDFTRAMRGVTRDVERLEKITSRSGGLFSADDLQDYERGLQRVQRHVQGLQREYRRASDEARRFQEELDDIQKSGGTVSQAQRDRLGKLQLRQTMVGSGLKQTQDREAVREQAGHRVRASVENRATGARWAKRGMAGLGAFAIGSILAGIQTAMEEDVARAQTQGISGSGGFGRMERQGLRYGMTRAQVHNIAQQTTRATGRYSQADVMSNMAMQRGYGISSGSFQQAARMGGDTATAQVLNRSILRAIKLGGIPRVLGEELTQTATSFMGQVTGARENVSASGMTGLIAMMGRRLGGVYRRAPGRTSQLLGGIHSTLTGGGGGEAGQAFLLRAAGFGSGKSYVQALEQLEKGVTDPQNIANMLKQTHLERQKMGIEAKMLHLHRLSGGSIKLHQSRRLMALRDPSDLGSVEAAMTGTGTASIEGEAGRVSRRLGFTKQTIQRQQERAALARTSKPLVDAYHKLSIKALGALSGGLKIVNNVTVAVTGSLKKLGNTLHKVGEKVERTIQSIEVLGDLGLTRGRTDTSGLLDELQRRGFLIKPKSTGRGRR